MLDLEFFGKWLDLLGEHYGRVISDDLGECYYSEFQHLSNAQFERGVRLCMRREPRFPPLDRIIELARATSERRADLEEFQPDTTVYDPNTPEAKAARAEIRQQLGAFRAARSPTPASGMAALGDALSGVSLAEQRHPAARPPVARRSA
ncbi:hypothetical protein [Halomicronema sp. CCY15110]|uniref:hypothetical protein n=1 Tax=Halomicronema sp. CCY15110 TaxID=2767773 RepID=UPI0019510864|nr:hypothetical protein [Halomicronema sp. CCY15110]